MMDTKQLEFWRGEFGDLYTQRNLPDKKNIASRIKLWSKILEAIPTPSFTSFLEVGSNSGLNIRALNLLTDSESYAIEPNQKALDLLIKDSVIRPENAFCASVFNMNMFSNAQIDLVFTCGVLIHIHPDNLKQATDEIVRISKRYIICVEYFSDHPQEVNYRGNSDVLFKRDFGLHYLEHYPFLRVIDYGFAWKQMTGLDNLTWWIFEKF